MKTGKRWKPMATITIQAGLFPPGPLKEVMEQEEITGTSKEVRHYLKMSFFSHSNLGSNVTFYCYSVNQHLFGGFEVVCIWMWICVLDVFWSAAGENTTRRPDKNLTPHISHLREVLMEVCLFTEGRADFTRV